MRYLIPLTALAQMLLSAMILHFLNKGLSTRVIKMKEHPYFYVFWLQFLGVSDKAGPGIWIPTSIVDIVLELQRTVTSTSEMNDPALDLCELVLQCLLCLSLRIASEDWDNAWLASSTIAMTFLAPSSVFSDSGRATKRAMAAIASSMMVLLEVTIDENQRTGEGGRKKMMAGSRLRTAYEIMTFNIGGDSA
ncbi:uncharacterized protein EV420DRAFT_1484928 [Desarmillaria tabescens]|uniref:Uncharacterized protein n=1 Tax=Armillaria tabescens TaxID=1929756 RepID=A0AA39JNK3_ARMTA|nr:uncharacterized protein EV420DRAFT_1484928 [Desarmillaria tabescens]KAK0443713.1 hypothetical protein EV420DRAFT_1484928 [Desarmillaria tabescens]